MKCNNNLTILQVFVGSGLGFDCASVSEIETMLSLGVEPSRIIYAHTQKHVSFIRRAKEAGVDLMTFDSAEELHKVPRLSYFGTLLRILSRKFCAVRSKPRALFTNLKSDRTQQLF